MSLMEEESQNAGVAQSAVALERRQRRQMLIALAMLLVALILVLIKDRQFFFPANSSAESEQVEHVGAAYRPKTGSAAIDTSAASQAKAKQHTQAASASAPTELPAAPVINRAALPPLEIEVVAGDQHRTVPTRNPSINVDLSSGATDSASTPPPSAISNAPHSAHLSPESAQVVARSVQPHYPVLAKQMKVQGSVVLQALIGKDGLIQDLQVLSGPSILSTAAREAVKQWRFKPYIQSGQPVETEARITVNFTISTF